VGKKASVALNPFELSPQILKNINIETKIPLKEIVGLEEMLENFRKLGIRDLIRYSGTENKIRLLLEGEDKKVLEESMETLIKFIKSKLC